MVCREIAMVVGLWGNIAVEMMVEVKGRVADCCEKRNCDGGGGEGKHCCGNCGGGEGKALQ